MLAWGPDLQRAWEAYTTFTITNFQGQPQNFILTRELVRQAWHLPFSDFTFNERGHIDDERYLCADELEPRWDQLNHQIIRLPLQIYMQHLHFPYPHRYFVPEKSIVVEFTLKQAFNRDSRKYFALAIMLNILRGIKSAITKGTTGSARRLMPYLGGVLVLTRIVYTTLQEETLLKPWEKPEAEAVGTKTIIGSRSSKTTKTAKSAKSRSSGNNRKSKPKTRGDSYKAQSKNLPPAQEEVLDVEPK